MNAFYIKIGKDVAEAIAKEAKEYAIKNYSNPLARKLAEWSYIAQAKAKAKRERKARRK